MTEQNRQESGNEKAQAPTSGIKHWGLSGYSNFLPRIKFSVTGQESGPQSPTISYRKTLALHIEEHPANK